MNKTLNLPNVFFALLPTLLLWLPVLLLGISAILWGLLITFSTCYCLYSSLSSRVRFALPISIAITFILGLAILILLGILLGHHFYGMSTQAIIYEVEKSLRALQASLPQSWQIYVPNSFEQLIILLNEHRPIIKSLIQSLILSISYLLFGAVLGIIIVVQLPSHSEQKPLSKKLQFEFLELIAGFIDVFFAQLRISALNGLLTGIFLFIILPLLGYQLPLAGTVLVITLIVCMIPLFGNIISSALIITLSLKSGLQMALISCAFMFAIHKLEYFLNAHIIGNHIQSKAWELLIMMTIMQAIFGMSGMIAAPIIYAQAKRALQHRLWV